MKCNLVHHYLMAVSLLTTVFFSTRSLHAETSEPLLRRDLIELRLYSTPVTRVTCTLRAVSEDEVFESKDNNRSDIQPGKGSGETKVVQWVPEGGDSLVRTVRVRSDLSWWLSCGSEPLKLSNESAAGSNQQQSQLPSRLFSYRLARKPAKAGEEHADARKDPKTTTLVSYSPRLTLRPTLIPSEDRRSFHDAQLVLVDELTGSATQSTVRLTASIKKLEEVSITSGNDQTQIASERSLISFDQVLKDLGTAVADVAVEKARSNAEALIQEKIATVFCDDLTIGHLWNQVPSCSSSQQGLEAWLPVPPPSSPPGKTPCLARRADSRSSEENAYCKRPLMEHTCQAVRTIRVRELAASGDALRKAVTLDLAELALSKLVSDGESDCGKLQDKKKARCKKISQGRSHAIALVGAFVKDALLSDTEVTQQRAQALLFALASKTGTIGNALPKGDWRNPFLLSLAVVSECLEQGECTADQLQRLWGQEYQLSSSGEDEQERILIKIRELLKVSSSVGLETIESAFHELSRGIGSGSTNDVENAVATALSKIHKKTTTKKMVEALKVLTTLRTTLTAISDNGALDDAEKEKKQKEAVYLAATKLDVQLGTSIIVDTKELQTKLDNLASDLPEATSDATGMKQQAVASLTSETLTKASAELEALFGLNIQTALAEKTLKDWEKVYAAVQRYNLITERKEVADTLAEWNQQVLYWLPTMRDILSPPAGTTKRQTVGRSLALSLSVLEEAWSRSDPKSNELELAEKRSVHERFAALRALVEALVNERYGEVVQQGGAILSSLIADSCKDEKGTCEVALTSEQAEKWFGVLGAFASYAGSYHAKSDDDLSSEELAKFQAEERKTAMKELINAATDRHGRGGDILFSLGVLVGTTMGQRTQRTKDASDEIGETKGRYEGLSLPTGVALEWLPRDARSKPTHWSKFWAHFGLHLQFSLLDLGQFVTVSDKELAEPTPATPFYFGGQVGVLVGTPKYNALFAFDGGYAPGMTYKEETDESTPKEVLPGGWRFGGSVGMFVPFLDFN